MVASYGDFPVLKLLVIVSYSIYSILYRTSACDERYCSRCVETKRHMVGHYCHVPSTAITVMPVCAKLVAPCFAVSGAVASRRTHAPRLPSLRTQPAAGSADRRSPPGTGDRQRAGNAPLGCVLAHCCLCRPRGGWWWVVDGVGWCVVRCRVQGVVGGGEEGGE